MAVVAITGTPAAGVNYTVTTASSADWASVSNSTYFYDLTDKLVHYKNSSGAVLEIYGVTPAGIIYITNQTTGAITYYSTLELARDSAVSGDTIYVNTGTYTVTTTISTGLAKNGVNWYFEPGAIINKTVTGPLFGTTGFTTTFDIRGSADFNLSSSATNLFNNAASLDFSNNVFEFRNAVCTSNNMFIGNVSYGTWRFNNITCSGGYCWDGLGACVMFFNKIYNTASYICGTIYSGQNTINGNKMESTTSGVIGGGNYTKLTLNVGFISGLNGAITLYDGAAAVLVVNGFINRINMNGYSWDVLLNGQCTRLDIAGGFFKGGNVCILNQSGGIVETSIYDSLAYPGVSVSITQSAGKSFLELSKSQTIGWNLTGGIMSLHGDYVNFGSNPNDRIVNGATAKLVFNDYFEIASLQPGNPIDYLVKLTLGTIRINSGATLKITSLLTNTNPLAKCITWLGGTIISNGGTMLTTTPEAPVILATVAGLNLKVLTGGLNSNRPENGGVLPAKKQKNKLTVAAAANSSVSLNDGSGAAEPFAVLVSGFATKALIAQQFVTLINASATLDITASQDIPGTDEYFYLESDVGGVPFTIASLVNLSNATIRDNGYAITNLTGGSILENSNVE